MTFVVSLGTEDLVEYREDKECFQECFYDKELKACGSCYRTLEEIARAGREKKEIKTRGDGHRSIKYDHSLIIEKIRRGMKHE